MEFLSGKVDALILTSIPNKRKFGSAILLNLDDVVEKSLRDYLKRERDRVAKKDSSISVRAASELPNFEQFRKSYSEKGNPYFVFIIPDNETEEGFEWLNTLNAPKGNAFVLIWPDSRSVKDQPGPVQLKMPARMNDHSSSARKVLDFVQNLIPGHAVEVSHSQSDGHWLHVQYLTWPLKNPEAKKILDSHPAKTLIIASEMDVNA